MSGKFILKETKAGKFVFNLVVSNGQVILTSETYKSKTSALKGIESVRRNSIKDTNFERRVGSNGQPYFILKASNREIIGHGEMYSSKSSMENGIASVMRNARSAKLEFLGLAERLAGDSTTDAPPPKKK